MLYINIILPLGMAAILYCCDKNNENVIHGDATSARVCFALGSVTDI